MLPFSMRRMKRHCLSALEGKEGEKAWSDSMKAILLPPTIWCLVLQLMQVIVELLKLRDVLVFAPKYASNEVLTSLPSVLERKSPTGGILQFKPPIRFGTAIEQIFWFFIAS